MSEPLWIVTGASRGIGKAIARTLAEVGKSLLLTATKLEHVAPFAADLRATPFELDLMNSDSIARFAQALEGQDIAGLVNNAGILERGSLQSITDAQIEHVLSVNVAGAVKITRASLAHMRSGARIVNIGSISGTLGTANASLYNASKWAMTGLTKSWAEELKPRGIFVAEVRPGSVDTDMLEQTPFPAQMQPEDVAKVVRHLLLDAPMAMTGAAVDVFG